MPEIKKYRPANGTEGIEFFNQFCDKCIHDDKSGGGSAMKRAEKWDKAETLYSNAPTLTPRVMYKNFLKDDKEKFKKGRYCQLRGGWDAFMLDEADGTLIYIPVSGGVSSHLMKDLKRPKP